MRTHRSNDEAMTLDRARERATAGNEPSGERTDIFAQYAPPFELTSDMLFVLALCPTAPLHQAFPGVPFLSLVGKTPLLLWFSRITEMCYHDTTGAQHCIGGSRAGLYDELNVTAFLRKPALFVPSIYATSDLTIQVGHRYGMPKRPTTMQVHVSDKEFSSSLIDGTRQSFVRAQMLGSGKGLAKVLAGFLPRWTWPVRFPGGRTIRALIQVLPRVQLAYVKVGQLALEVRWLTHAIRLLPVGCSVPDLRMHLPPPEQHKITPERRYPFGRKLLKGSAVS